MIVIDNNRYETLYDFLVAHKDDIEYVKLTWVWPDIKIIESNKKVMKWDTKYNEYYPVSLDIGFSVDVLDEEYTFWGPIEDAIKFADSYDCWDSLVDGDETIVIEDGVLEEEHTGDNFEMHYHPHTLDTTEYYTSCQSLGYMMCKDGDNWYCVMPHDGPIVDGHYDKDENGYETRFVIDRILGDSPGHSTWESHLCKQCTKYDLCKNLDPLKTPPIKVMEAGEGRFLYDPVCPLRDLKKR